MNRPRPACRGADRNVSHPKRREDGGRASARRPIRPGGLRPKSGRAAGPRLGSGANGKWERVGQKIPPCRILWFRQHFDGAAAECLERGLDLVPVGARGNHEDRGRPLRHDPLGRLKAVHHRHLDVHEDHVWREPDRLLHRLRAVSRLAEDLEVGHSGDQAAQHRPNGRRVVDDQHADGRELLRHEPPSRLTRDTRSLASRPCFARYASAPASSPLSRSSGRSWVVTTTMGR